MCAYLEKLVKKLLGKSPLWPPLRLLDVTAKQNYFKREKTHGEGRVGNL